MFSWLRRLFGPDPTPPPPPPLITVTASVVRSTYDPNVDLHPDYPLHAVGESYYQAALREIVESSADPGPNWPYAGAQCEVMAQVVPENDNPYDDQAVRVEIDGHKVGHLSRADARAYRRVFEHHPIPIKAIIIGGWEHKGETYEQATGHFGVRLQLRIEE